jgi:hypothetical protein
LEGVFTPVLLAKSGVEADVEDLELQLRQLAEDAGQRMPGLVVARTATIS